MRNLGKLKTLYIAKQEKKMHYPSFECSKPALYHMVDNKQLKLTASTVHWTLSFCIALCSVELFGSVVLGEHDFELELVDDLEKRKFLHRKKLR